MVDKRRQKRIQDYIRDIAAEFIEKESLRKSLITITKVEILPNLSRAILYISVLPEEFEQEALHFLRRKRPEIREYIKNNTKLRRIPFVDIKIDKGEKNLQKIFEISS